MKIRIYLLVGFLALFGIIINVVPRRAFAARTESWMEQQLPPTFNGYSFQQSPDNPQQSYKMNDITYETLKPYGIVARDYSNGNLAFDVVVIAGRDVKTFHDPRVCFTGQGYEITKEVSDSITTPRGVVPISIAETKGPQGVQKAIFFYRGPKGFYGTTRDLKMALFMARLRGEAGAEGVFYRVMPNVGTTSVDDVKTFIGQYLAATEKSSGGFF